jgi:hypothetical protein
MDGIGVFVGLLLRVGIVEAQVAGALVILGEAEVQANGFGVANMQVTIRLGRKTGGDGGMLAAGQVGFDDGSDEMLNLRVRDRRDG